MPGLVRRFETVRIDVGIPDHVTVLVNAKFLPALIPVAPGVDCAIGLNLGVDEEILDPPVAGAGKGIAEPRNTVRTGWSLTACSRLENEQRKG